MHDSSMAFVFSDNPLDFDIPGADIFIGRAGNKLISVGPGERSDGISVGL